MAKSLLEKNKTAMKSDHYKSGIVPCPNLGYPYSYGDSLSGEQAKKNLVICFYFVLWTCQTVLPILINKEYRGGPVIF